MIASVLTYKGQTKSPTELFRDLVNIQSPMTRYPVRRALGSIGGAITQGFIAKNASGDYVRLR